MRKEINIIFLLLLLGCKNQNKSVITDAPFTDINNEHNDSIVLIDLQKHYEESEISLQDYADVEYIQLETNEKALLKPGDISSLKWFGDQFAISDLKAVHFFSRSGKYLKTVDRRGPSGEDYFQMLSFAIDDNAKELVIYNSQLNNKKFKIYDLDSNYKRELSLPNNSIFQSFFDYTSEYLFAEDTYNVDNIEIDDPNNKPYCLI